MILGQSEILTFICLINSKSKTNAKQRDFLRL